MTKGDWRPFFANKVSLRPSPTLEKLAEHVLLLSIKRSPRWKFRIAPDFAVELQSKAKVAFQPGNPRTEANLIPIRIYQGVALLADGDLDAKAFVDNQVARTCWRLKFEVQDWVLRNRGIRWPPGTGQPPDQARFVDMQHRIAEAFECGFFERLAPSKLFGLHCLCCGKALTDPVSQARLIGPECARDSSENIRRIFDLQPMEEPAV